MDKSTENNQVKINIDIFTIIALGLAIYSAYLAWSCNRDQSMLLRILHVIVAFSLGWIYLIYYYAFKVSSCSS